MFLALCYSWKFSSWDLEVMTIGDCFDYIAEFVEFRNPENPDKENTRTATQDDFDSF
ncbi:hypothetical protein ADK18_02390 [Bacillus anthracis]|nr:hypothetical protein ADK18_02390 [Bacillus anthracis]